MDFNWMNQRNRYDRAQKESVISSANTKHPRCLGDGVDDCGYNTTIDCSECKFNNAPYGRKDPSAKCNQ